MLAYVFWHRPREDVDRDAYEAAQRDFHRTLDVTSACFRLSQLPFGEDPGYEDWYLVGDWAGLGRLNEAAIGPARRPGHDRAADLASNGWGAVYGLQRGAAEIPAGIEWRAKPRGEPAATFLDRLGVAAAWRRELVLGPAPEFCLVTAAGSGREQI